MKYKICGGCDQRTVLSELKKLLISLDTTIRVGKKSKKFRVKCKTVPLCVECREEKERDERARYISRTFVLEFGIRRVTCKVAHGERTERGGL